MLRFILLIIPFIPVCSFGQTVTDADGNSYGVVVIGSQVWMNENLRTTRFSNGDTIPTTDSCYSVITSEFEPVYQWAYNCLDSLIPVYGRLYTWYVAIDPRNVCPVNWHVPSLAEFNALASYLGGSAVAGGKLKQTGFALWQTPNSGATNEVGYNGVPNGHRSLNGYFNGLHTVSDSWTTTTGTIGARDFDLNHDTEAVTSYDDNKEFGFAIRCIKDSTSGIIDANYEMGFSIYPNPAADELNIAFDSPIQIDRLEISNELGQVMLTVHPNTLTFSLNTANLAEGIYFLTAYSQHQGNITKRFVILR